MTEISDFLHQANWGLPGGNFEFNRRDGEIKYTYKCSCAGLHAPTDEMIATSLCNLDAAFRVYEEGIIDILFKGVSAEKALVRCESNARLKEVVDRLEALVRVCSDEEDCGDDLGEKSHISFSEDFLKLMAERPVEEDDCCEAE